MPVTDHIETTADIISFIETQLSTSDKFKVETYQGTSYHELARFIPALRLPAAVICYSGSTYANRPRRTLDIAVVVSVKSLKSDRETVRELAEEVISLLDEQIIGNARFRVTADEPLDLGPGTANIVVSFSVEDH